MQLPDTVTLHQRVFAAIRTRRSGRVRVYRSGNLFLKLGDVDSERGTHQALLAHGAPLAEIVESGTHLDMPFYVERSLGDDVLGHLFRQDVDATGTIGEPHFREFLDVACRFAEAQLCMRVSLPDPAAFASGIEIDLLMLEFPVWRSKVSRCFDEAIGSLHAFPYVVSHGDFNAHNMFPAGVIDLDDAFLAPAGYDLISALVHTEYFAPDPTHDLMQRYTFSPTQRARYLSTLDDLYIQAGLPRPSDFLHHFEFCRAVWLCVGMHDHPHMRAFRMARLKERFLNTHE